jgi:NAD(P)H-hydrate epimerase
MVVGGSRGMTGAPMLAGRAALRAGAGIVFCLLPGADAAVHASGSEVITRAVAAVDGALAPEAVPDVLERSARFRAVAVGPGLGGDAPAARAVRALVDGLGVPLVLDADGLNALDGDLAPLAERAARGGATVLTPHDGEYRRLVGRPVGDDRIEAARELAGRSGSVVLLKGPTTVIAEPPNPERRPGRIVLNATGTSLLASAGTGDVLTGVVAALVARGAPPFEAAAAAAWVHGRAAARVGPGLVAGDLVAALAPTLALERAGRDDAGAEHAQ